MTAAVTEKHEALLGEIQRLTLENERLEALFKRAIVDLDALKEREEKRIQTMESFTELGSVLRDRGLESERELGAGIQAIAHLKPVEQWLSHLYVKEGAGFSDWWLKKCVWFRVIAHRSLRMVLPLWSYPLTARAVR